MKAIFFFTVLFFSGYVSCQEFNKAFFDEYEWYNLSNIASIELKKYNLVIEEDSLNRAFNIVQSDTNRIMLNGFISNIVFGTVVCEIEVVMVPCCCSDEKLVTRYFFTETELIKVDETIISSDLLVPMVDFFPLSEIFVSDSAIFYNTPSMDDIFEIDVCTGEELNINNLGKLRVDSGTIVYSFGESWSLVYAKLETTGIKSVYRIGWVYIKDE